MKNTQQQQGNNRRKKGKDPSPNKRPHPKAQWVAQRREIKKLRT
jgi:hypothetical protein